MNNVNVVEKPKPTLSFESGDIFDVDDHLYILSFTYDMGLNKSAFQFIDLYNGFLLNEERWPYDNNDDLNKLICDALDSMYSDYWKHLGNCNITVEQITS